MSDQPSAFSQQRSAFSDKALSNAATRDAAPVECRRTCCPAISDSRCAPLYAGRHWSGRSSEGAIRPRRSRQRAGTTRGWQQGQRWWQGDAPEWDIVSSSIDGRSTLAGEVKWSESPTDRADLERIAAALLARPWPPSLADPTHYALFVPRVATAAETTFDAVPVVDAAAVMRALR